MVLVSRRWAAPPRAANLSAFLLPMAKWLSALVWAGVQEMEMELLCYTWLRMVCVRRAIMRLFATGRIERVAKSLTQ